MAKRTRELEPSYMVRVPDPTTVRRDILESLREIILFMQAYEHFSTIQEEKKAIMDDVKNQVKEISRIINTDLKSKMPRGKLKALHDKYKVRETKPLTKAPVRPKREVDTSNSLDNLENQLRDIERQLKEIQ